MSILGIDFGATKIVAAFYDSKTQKSDIILDNEECRSTSCCLAFTKNERLFSKAAEYQAVNNPENTIFGRDIKRMIGNDKEDCKIETFIKSELNADKEGELKLTYRNEQISIFPEHMIAMLLSRIRENAENRLSRTFSQAVVSVPAMFNAKQRNALKTACSAAGLEVQAFLNNTTAAAVHYAVERKFSGYSRKILIFDMGATSFEVGVFEIRNNHVTTLASNGSLDIGGENFVDRLKNHYLQQMVDHDIFIQHDNEKLSRVRDACEKVKIVLSTTNWANVKVETFHNGYEYEFKMYRDHFEHICKDLFDKIYQIVHETVKNVNDIEEFIIIGGGGRIPKVEEILRRALNTDNLSKILNQDESIVDGAALYAAKSDIFTVHEVTSTELSIQNVIIARKGEKLPKTHEITFKQDGNHYSGFEIFQDSFKNKVLLASTTFNSDYLNIKTDIDFDGLLKVVKNEVSVILDLQKISEKKVKKMQNLDKKFENFEKEHKTLQVKLNSLESKCYKYRRSLDSKELCDVLTENDKHRVREVCDSTVEWIKNAQYSIKDDLIAKQELLDDVCFNTIEKAKEKHAHKVLEATANQNFSDKEFEKAIEGYTKLIEQSKEYEYLVVVYRCNRGRAFYYLGKWEEAIKDFDILLEQSFDKRNLEKCRFYRAKCHFLLKDFDACLKDLDHLLKENDLNFEFKRASLELKIRATLATCGVSKEYRQNSLELSRIDEFLSDHLFMQHLKETNRNLVGEMFLKRATCNFFMNYPDAALEDLEKASHLLDNHGEIFKLRAHCFFQIDKLDQAEQEIESCLLVTEEGSDTRSDLLMLSAEIANIRKQQAFEHDLKQFRKLRSDNAYSEVLKMIQKIKKENSPLPDDIVDELIRAGIEANYHHSKKAREGILDCSILLSKQPRDIFALQYRAKFHLADNCKWKAEGDLRRILTIVPEDREATEILGRIKDNNGFWRSMYTWTKNQITGNNSNDKNYQIQDQKNGDKLGANSDDEGPSKKPATDTLIEIGDEADGASSSNVTELRKVYETPL